jgi:Protein of unknown function (DUF3303)
MLYLVIERFKQGDPQPVGERFKSKGRMLPEGVSYISSWMEPSGSRCFQIMEAPDLTLLDEWMKNWNDLVDFEIISVVASADYWSRR